MRMGDRALTEMAGRRAVTQVERAKVVEIEMCCAMRACNGARKAAAAHLQSA